MKKYVLEIIVFICGAAGMILELAGSRVLAPYVGTSTYVWTSLIGIILGSLSMGYWIGGRLADKKADFMILSAIIFTSSVYIGIISIFKQPVLETIQYNIPDLRTAACTATVILFAFPSVLLGMVSPYAVKLKISTLDASGTTVGNLYAVSTIGSIAGTFAAGFILIPALGNTKILLMLAVMLSAISLFTYYAHASAAKIAAIVIFLFLFSAVTLSESTAARQGNIDLDTEYNRVRIYDDIDGTTGRPIRIMRLGDAYSSAMFLDGDDLAFEYTRYYDLAAHFNPGFKKALMIGAAAYSYPKHYINTYPSASMDVVEIDSALTELAKKYFNLAENPRLNIYHEDARMFLNTAQERYDAVFIDAFNARSVPYHLTTKEVVQKQYDILNENGVVLLNIISSVEGESGEFLRAEYATYKSVFPHVLVFPVYDPEDGARLQNIIIAALKSDAKPVLSSEDETINEYLAHIWKGSISEDKPVLTDEYAPVDHYSRNVVNR